MEILWRSHLLDQMESILVGVLAVKLDLDGQWTPTCLTILWVVWHQLFPDIVFNVPP